MHTKYIIRFDDITPGMAWQKFLPLKTYLEKNQIKCILGVVPDSKDVSLDVEPINKKFFTQVRAWQAYGDTIAQHGTHHVYTTDDPGILEINRRSEFAGHDYDYQLDLLSQGQKILRDESIYSSCFMAPSHSFDYFTLRALTDIGFESITDGYGFYPYREGKILMIPQLSSVPFNIGFGYATICLHINTITPARLNDLRKFLVKNRQHIVDPKEIVLGKATSNRLSRPMRKTTEIMLKAWRTINHRR